MAADRITLPTPEVQLVLDGAAEWKEMLAEALEQTGGPLTDQERAWADGILQGRND